jgi:hypothetical protein
MAPKSVARGGPTKRGSGSVGDARPHKVYMGRQQPATGSHLPLEETAPPYGSRLILLQPARDELCWQSDLSGS